MMKKVYDSHRNLTPTKDAELYYQFETDNNLCIHCPQYVKLIREINKIVEKVEPTNGESIGLQNESLLQLNRLKFLYYEVKVQEENGGEKCLQYQHADVIGRRTVSTDSLTLLAEEALSLPNVTSIQYIPKLNEKEIRYFYRGEGLQRDVVVEVVMYPDRRAVIRYHRFKGFSDDIQLPDLGSSAKRPSENTSHLVPAIISQESVISEDKGKLDVGGRLKIRSDSIARINKQSLGVSLNDESGKDLVKVDVKHKTLNIIEVSTLVPMEWKLQDGGLTVGGALSYQETNKYREDKSKSQTKSVVLGLTDHNHEYFKTTLISKDNIDQVILSSRYSLGGLGSVSASGSRDSIGRKEFIFSHGMSDMHSTTTTKIGMSPDAKRYFELQREKRIGKDQTIVLSIRTNDRHETSIMYQYKLRLR